MTSRLIPGLALFCTLLTLPSGIIVLLEKTHSKGAFSEFSYPVA